jgi:hydroxymethylglutaryl-CoA synthase
VDQCELEVVDGCIGKYTKGLGMNKIAVPEKEQTAFELGERVLLKLIREHNINIEDIGRLEVATESMTDKSKSFKSRLMKHFQSKNKHIEGVDSYHACYAGSSLLFSATDWGYSPYWNGKKAIVITTDIADWGNDFKFLNGAGAVAILLGPTPTIELTSLRSTSCTDEYDFYKPISSLYPIFDGPKSIDCYMEKLKECIHISDKNELLNSSYWIFHGTTYVMCKKACECLSLELGLDPEKCFKDKTELSLSWMKESGSLFTSSLFTNLACLLHNLKGRTEPYTVLCFSYGSGSIATIYKLNSIELDHSVYPPWTDEHRTRIDPQTWVNSWF